MQKIKNILQITTIIIGNICAPFVFGMEKDTHIIDSQEVAIEVFVRNQNKHLSHEIIYTLAAVNRSLKKLLLNTAPERKGLLLHEAKHSFSFMQEPYYFNQYGSFLCGKEIKKSLTVSEYRLAGDRVKISHGFCWSNFTNLVTALPQPFLNPEGDVCYYGWGKFVDEKLWGKYQHLIQYYRQQDGHTRNFRCGVQIGVDNNWALSFFAALPNLLKVFANCPVIQKDVKCDWMLFALKDAIIPDNYAEYQDCGDIFLNVKFDDLPGALKEAIVARYQECRK